jgi:UrcA family protein
MSIKHIAGQLVAATVVTLGLAGFAAPSAHAESLTRSTTVRFDDLNLSSEAGARALYGRIVSAAREVCGSDGSVASRSELLGLHACVAESTRRAVVNVNAPSLNALYSRQIGALFQPKS